jgi:hypothetical protein
MNGIKSFDVLSFYLLTNQTLNIDELFMLISADE